MQKVISINLNGNAYQLDESGYDALHEYLASAERALASNPDRAEIMADLEQAIADKCQKFLGAAQVDRDDGGGPADRQGDGPNRTGSGQRGSGPCRGNGRRR